MDRIKALVEELFPDNPALLFIGLLIVTLIVQMLGQATYLMLLSRPRAMVIALLLCFTLIIFVGTRLSLFLLERWGMSVPSVALWFVPVTILLIAYLFFLCMLVAFPAYAGRGIWSDLVRLNAQTTTIMFVTTFISFKIYIALVFIGALSRYIGFWLDIFRDVDNIRERLAELDENRKRGSKFNRISFLLSLVIVFLSGCWVVFFNPETILYYRGEIQIKSGLNPEVAIETFAHLVRKYPNYRYIDTVEFRSAWVLERRMGKYREAIEAYSNFLKKFGYENVWADEVVANLIRISLDKLKDADETLKWVKIYQEKFSSGLMAPHVALYEIRAMILAGRRDEAQKTLAKALERFRNEQIIIFDSEDYFVTTLPFEVAASIIEI